MRRTLLLAFLTLLVLVFCTTLLVEVRSVDEPLPAPDLAMPIHQPDGTLLPLAEVIARANAPRPAEAPPVLLAPDTPAAFADTVRSPEALERLIQQQLEREPTVFRLAELARHEGRLDEALALYQSVPEDDDSWGRAQRRIAWDILTKGKGDPRRGVAYAQAALRADPLTGNTWHDAARVYGSVLGFEMD
jgi:hypothetical protein